MRARREKRKLEQEHRRAAGHAVSAHSQLRPTTETRHGQDVGSSGSLLFHPARGAEIDRADLVVRFNDAPVEGFERFVGNRTDVRLNNTYAIGKVLTGCAKRGGGAPWTNQIPTAPALFPSTCSAFLGFPKDNACCPREYMILNSGFGTYARCAQRLCPRSADARVLAGPAARSVKGRHAWMSGSLGMLALSKWCERGVTNLYGGIRPRRLVRLPLLRGMPKGRPGRAHRLRAPAHAGARTLQAPGLVRPRTERQAPLHDAALRPRRVPQSHEAPVRQTVPHR